MSVPDNDAVGAVPDFEVSDFEESNSFDEQAWRKAIAAFVAARLDMAIADRKRNVAGLTGAKDQS